MNVIMKSYLSLDVDPDWLCCPVAIVPHDPELDKRIGTGYRRAQWKDF